MRIGIDVRSLLDIEPSGVGEYTFNLLKNIFDEDNENQYVLFYNIFKKSADRLLVDNFKDIYANVEVKAYNFPNRIFNPFVQYFNYPKIDKLIGGVDVFFAPNLHFLSLSKNCKKVVSVHDISFRIYPDLFSYRKNVWHSSMVINPSRFITKADKILAVSENTKRDIIKYYHIPEEKIIVTHLSVSEDFKLIKDKLNSEDFKAKQTELKNKYKLPDNFLLTLSTLEPRKNITSVIIAFEKLKRQNLEKYKDLELVIAGGRGWKCKDIYKKVENSEFNNQIKLLGYIDRKDKPYIYNAASLFVWPSFYEGFGIPPLEAMASGTVVVTSAVSSLPEVVEDAALIINPFNIAEITKAIDLVLSSPELRSQLVDMGFKQVDKFSWKKTAAKTLQVIKSTII